MKCHIFFDLLVKAGPDQDTSPDAVQRRDGVDGFLHRGELSLARPIYYYGRRILTSITTVLTKANLWQAQQSQ